MPTESTAESISKKFSWLCYTVTFSLIIPILAAILVYQLDSFESAPMPIHELTHPLPTPTMKNDHILKGSEFLGVGQLLAPEDIVYDTGSKVIYTGCVDGWIKRVTINDSVADSVVENWVHTGGRPLGLALGHRGEVIVADAYKGLLKISRNGAVELLTDEAEGVKFKLTDGVAVAEDGTIYFTDASHKYDLHDCMWDILEGEPHGRLLSYDPSTKKTQVLVHHLYFANGIAISPDQDYLVFSETPMGRCKKYYIHGNKKGRIEKFIDLPGLLDNIHYDGHGHFWIASATEITYFWKLAFRYPIVRKAAAIYLKYIGPIEAQKSGGVFVVSLEGKLISHYYDPKLILISCGVKIGNHLYYGSILYPYIIRLDLAKHPAYAATATT